jgi:hypothetical protein
MVGTVHSLLGEILSHHGDLVIRNLGAGRDHALDEELPILGSVPGAGDQRERVASGAGSFDDGLRVTGRQRPRRGLLTLTLR